MRPACWRRGRVFCAAPCSRLEDGRCEVCWRAIPFSSSRVARFVAGLAATMVPRTSVHSKHRVIFIPLGLASGLLYMFWVELGTVCRPRATSGCLQLMG
jgi:hypothetical protein